MKVSASHGSSKLFSFESSCALIVAAFCVCAEASASTNTTTTTASVSLSGEQALDMARRLVDKGEYEEADKILSKLMAADPDKLDVSQVKFLRGLIASASGENETAEELFRQMLDEDPKLIRVRLELARVLFEQEKDVGAAYHFRLVLGNGLPEETIKRVRSYLRQIEARKKYSTRLGVSLMPNTNINAGPKDDTVMVFGLPFQLDEEAQKKSGVGLSSSLQVAAFPKITKNLRMEARAGLRVADYSNKDFDDVFATVEAGPRIQTKKLSTSVLATASKRYFAGEEYSSSYGGRLVVTTPLSNRLRFMLRGSFSEVTYDTRPERDGPVYSIGASLARIIDKRTQGGFGLQVTQEKTDAENLQNTQYRLNTYLKREFANGITLQVVPEYILRDFDVAQREDETLSLTLQATKRDWRYYGFAPVFSYTYMTNDSTNPFYDYDRHSADVGMTREF